MKNFDIENLERKNIYKTPDNFFEKVQQNVLNETVFKENKVVELKPQRKRNLNWMYAAAATLALIFGGLFIFTQGEDGVEGSSIKIIASNGNNTATDSNSVNKPETEAAKNYYAFANDLNAVEEESQTNSTTERPTEIKKTTITETKTVAKTTPTKVQPQEQVDLLLETLSAEEISSLAQNTENDIYLDLYN